MSEQFPTKTLTIGAVCMKTPLDLLDFTRAIHALFTDKQTISKVLDGTYASIDDFDSAFDPT